MNIKRVGEWYHAIVNDALYIGATRDIAIARALSSLI